MLWRNDDPCSFAWARPASVVWMSKWLQWALWMPKALLFLSAADCSLPWIQISLVTGITCPRCLELVENEQSWQQIESLISPSNGWFAPNGQVDIEEYEILEINASLKELHYITGPLLYYPALHMSFKYHFISISETIRKDIFLEGSMHLIHTQTYTL